MAGNSDPKDGTGFRYTVVDMSLPGNGKNTGAINGEVIPSQQDIELFAPCAEKIAVGSKGCNELWVVGHGFANNSFHTFKLTPNGIEKGPVSAVGTILEAKDHKGNLLFRRNTTELINISLAGYVEIFDFNKETGEITGPKLKLTNPGGNPFAIGLSPNDRFLYTTFMEGQVYQYDLEAANPKATEFLVANLGTILSKPKVGPDQKMYVPGVGRTALSVINNPNVGGAGCSFDPDGFDLKGNKLAIGAMPDMFDEEDEGVLIDSIIPVHLNCETKGKFEIFISGGLPPYKVSINKGPFTEETVYTDLGGGMYEIDVVDKNGCTISGSIEILGSGDKPKIILDPTDVYCDNLGQFIVRVTGGVKPYEISVNGGDFTDKTTYKNLQEGMYEVTVKDKEGCTGTSMVEINKLTEDTEIEIDPVPDLCLQGEPVQLTANINGGNFNGPGVIGDMFNPGVAGIGSHTITCTAPVECGKDGSVIINVVEAPSLEITTDKKIGCAPLEVTFSNINGAGLVNCNWDLGNAATSMSCDKTTTTYTKPGCYNVGFSAEIAQGCKSKIKEVGMVCVVPNPVAIFTSSPTEIIPESPLVKFINQSIGDSLLYEWTFPNSETSTETNPSHSFNYQEVVYTVCLKASSKYGCKDSLCQDMEVKGEFFIYVPNAFTPDADGVNDWFFPVLYGHKEGTFSMQIFNRWGESVFRSKDPNIGWEGNGNKGDDNTSNTDRYAESVYVWKITVEEKSSGKTHRLTGHVSLLK